MKTIKHILWASSFILLANGCNPDDFLDKKPKDQLIAGNVFENYESIKAYSWQFYEVFPGYLASVPNADWDGDLFDRAAANPTGESDWAYQRVVVPTASDFYTVPFQNIRAVNIMLDQLDQSSLDERDKNHWKGVGYFFRAYNYFNLVCKYGDITWLEHEISDGDVDILFGPRTPRAEVTRKMLENLQFAEANIKTVGDGPNTVTPHVVRAFISRFGLFEGTWRKYHGIAGGDVFLRASRDASMLLINAFPALHPNYDEDFNSASLASVPGILLYKLYHTGQVVHNLASASRNSSGLHDVSKKGADMYLMTDGQTRWTSPLFEGEKSPYTEFRNRDRRMYYTIQPPFKVIAGGNQSREWQHTNDPADREYFELMAEISDPLHKALPASNWNGFIMREAPHYFDNNLGQPFMVTNTGYKFYKYYNQLNTGIQNQDISDAPIFRMAEVLANHAEATYELGEFDQAVADLTVNKLRSRGHVAPLRLSQIHADPQRDTDVDPVLWEIRRERAIELMGEGFRFDDLRRWRKLHYLEDRKLGRWIVRTSANSRIPILNNASEGYIAYRSQPSKMPDHYYLYPVPSNQIVITNGKVAQNTGW